MFISCSKTGRYPSCLHGYATSDQWPVYRDPPTMVASIGVIASPSQGAGYFERDGYYARDDPAHREGSSLSGAGYFGVACSC